MIGTLLGNRYELIEKIGEGGMAEVYRAKCHLLNRFVAVKILKEEYSKDNEFVEKFKREAAAVASLSDSNIVNIYDVGSHENTHYIVMEYVKGKTLKEILQRDIRLDYNRAIDIATQIAKALECAHRNNVIHRDVKPHNILVSDNGDIKVTDFGIAKASSSVTITNTSKVMGSAHYFSPEQAKGSFVDFRTDIYSLGIVLYEMVTGKVPYDAESPVAVALKHIQDSVVPPKHLNPSIPEGLNQLILKAVEKEPIKRYQSIKDMIVDLQRIKSNSSYVVTNNFIDDHTRIMEPVTVDEDEFDEDDEKSFVSGKKKKKLLFSLLAVIVLGLGVVSGTFLFGKKGPIGPIGGDTVTMPSIIGKTQEEAEKLVKEARLTFTVADRQKSDKPEGTVLECNYRDGEKVEAKSEVRVTISSGQDVLTVGNYKDMPIEQAKEYIKNAGLQLGEIKEEFSDIVVKGNVISQTPDADSPIKKDIKVVLTVSKGPKEVKVSVPDLTGKTIKEAQTLLTNNKLKLGQQTETRKDTDDKNKDGKIEIISQSQAANSQVKADTVIDVTYVVYKYVVKTETVKVESFAGKTYKEIRDAISELKSKGINVDVVDSEGTPIPAPGDNYTVAKQSFTGDMEKGKTLIITLNAHP